MPLGNGCEKSHRVPHPLDQYHLNCATYFVLHAVVVHELDIEKMIQFQTSHREVEPYRYRKIPPCKRLSNQQMKSLLTALFCERSVRKERELGPSVPAHREVMIKIRF